MPLDAIQERNLDGAGLSDVPHQVLGAASVGESVLWMKAVSARRRHRTDLGRMDCWAYKYCRTDLLKIRHEIGFCCE